MAAIFLEQLPWLRCKTLTAAVMEQCGMGLLTFDQYMFGIEQHNMVYLHCGGVDY